MSQIQLWKDREKREVDPEFFSIIADEKAKSIGLEDNRKNKGTQLRRFFDEIVRLNSQAQRKGTDWNHILPQLHMLISKAAYAKGRKLVTDSFVELLKGTIMQVRDKDDLKVLTSFFEAFMGFYKVYKPNET